LFGRRKREDVTRADEAREAERRALFEQLARRPETVCPFLGLAEDRAGYQPEPTADHRCYAFGDPAPLSDEQQRHVCLERGYSNCPRYLRGVLVIPTEELEALRRPQPHVAPPPPPPPKAVAPRSRRRRNLLVVLPLLILLVAAVGTGGLYLTNPNFLAGLIGAGSQTPAPSASSTVAASATPVPTPIVLPSSGILPTPGPGDTPTGGYAVYVMRGTYPVFRLDSSGTVTGTASAVFARVSAAPVKKIVGSDGANYWQTLLGTYTGLCYTKGKSGDFAIYAVYQTASGEPRFRKLSDSEL
jgi:hypothetical protein